MSKRIFCILLLLTMCLTACGGQKAGATSGKSSTEATTAIATTQENTDSSTESEEIPVVEGEFENPIGITEEVSEEASEVSGPIGTPDHPMAVDPAPYWKGEDYFDIESYLRACCASYIALISNKDDHYVSTTINKRHIHIEGNGHTLLWVDYNNNTFAAPDIETSEKVVWINKDRDLYLYSTSLDTLFAIMPAITSGLDCPFAGSGIKHGDIAGYWAIHDD